MGPDPVLKSHSSGEGHKINSQAVKISYSLHNVVTVWYDTESLEKLIEIGQKDQTIKEIQEPTTAAVCFSFSKNSVLFFFIIYLRLFLVSTRDIQVLQLQKDGGGE